MSLVNELLSSQWRCLFSFSLRTTADVFDVIAVESCWFSLNVCREEISLDNIGEAILGLQVQKRTCKLKVVVSISDRNISFPVNCLVRF